MNSSTVAYRWLAHGAGVGSRRRVTCLTVRLTEFWRRMREQFGNAYAESVAKDHVFAKLDSRTVNQALADGVDAKTIWRVVSDEFDVPQHLR